MFVPIDAFLLSSYKDNMLLFAASTNHLPLLKRALSAGADVNYSAGRKDTPLVHAVSNGHEQCVDLLLDYGADSNATDEGETLLVLAIDANHTSLATRFLHQMDATAVDHAIEQDLYMIIQAMFDIDSGLARSHPTPLHRAVLGGLQYVKLCIDHGADINALQGPDEDGEDGGYTALGIAAHRGDLGIMEYLLQEGADVDAGEGMAYPVVGAVRRSHPEALNMLLRHGVDIAYYRNETDLLYLACESGQATIVKMLLDAFEAFGGDWTWVGDADPDLLLTAVRHEHVAVVQLLLERGAEVNAISAHYHESALLSAVKAGSIELVDMLLEGGADPRMIVGGKTPLMWVKESNRPVLYKGRMMALLLRGGADLNELSKRWTKRIHAFVRQLEQEMLGE